jgi:hypothetical protein
MKRDTMSQTDATMKIAAYNNMLEVETSRLKQGTSV